MFQLSTNFKSRANVHFAVRLRNDTNSVCNSNVFRKRILVFIHFAWTRIVIRKVDKIGILQKFGSEFRSVYESKNAPFKKLFQFLRLVPFSHEFSWINFRFRI